MPSDTDHHGQQNSPSQDEISADALLNKCRTLLKELDKFEAACLAVRGHGTTSDIRPLRNAVASELKSLERLSSKPSVSPRTAHTLRSSNLPFLSAVWNTAKQHTAIVAFQKRFYWEYPWAPVRTSRNPAANRKPRKKSALTDIVASNGSLWIKVSTISESRLLFQLAKAGWDSGGEDSDSDWDGGKVNGLAGPDGMPALSLSEKEDADSDSDSDDRVELLKIAEDLQRAAKAVRVRYAQPKILFVLTKVQEGSNPAVDAILESIRATGASIHCGPFESTNSTNLASPTAPFEALIPSPHPPLTDTLNLDCTILLALASDLSHQPQTPEPAQYASIQRQIALEAATPLLPTALYPAFVGRELVTAPAAVKRMREIVAQIGTPGEKARAAVLLGESDSVGLSEEERLRDWTRTSMHPAPPGLRLPVRVVDEDVKMEELPPVAARVDAEVDLSEVNRGTLWLGWKNGWLTVSSNRVVVKGVERVIGAWLDELDEKGGGEEEVKVGLKGLSPGPEVWICGVARSLIGKDSGRG